MKETTDSQNNGQSPGQQADQPTIQAIEPIIDIGCNLTHDSFDSDRDRVLQDAKDAGVVQMVITGASEEGSRIALELAKDNLSVIIRVENLRETYVHELIATGIRDTDGNPLLHPEAYYTLNKIPKS